MARPCGLDLRNLHPVIDSGNRAFPRTMGCRVSELGGRLCVRNGAWQPFRGLRQTSSGFVLPSRAGPGGCKARRAHPGPGLTAFFPPPGKLSQVGGAQVGGTLGAGFTGTWEGRGPGQQIWSVSREAL